MSAFGNISPGQFHSDPDMDAALQGLAKALEHSYILRPGRSPLEDANTGYGGHIQEARDRSLHVGGEPVRKLYRIVDPGEWSEAKGRGYLQSHGGYTRASAAPDERRRYQGEAGVRGHALEIDYHPEDQWHASAEGYASTRAPIPLSRVRNLEQQKEAGE